MVNVVAFAAGLTAISAIAITPKSAISDKNIFIIISLVISVIAPWGETQCDWIMIVVLRSHNIPFRELIVFWT